MINERIKKLKLELGIKDKDIKKILSKKKEIENTKFNKISFTIYGDPLQTARPRCTKFGRFYVPNASKNKKFIKSEIKKQFDVDKFIKDNGIIQGDVHIKMKFYVAIPKSFPKTDKLLAEMKYIKPLTTPDIDNFMKTYMDALTGFLWLDDGQVNIGKTFKYYSVEPRVEIEMDYTNEIFNSKLRTYAKNKKENFDNLN